MAENRVSKLQASTRKRLGRLRLKLGLEYQSKMTDAQLSDHFEGKSVAVVGNARSLENSRFGEAIDAHDIVIRMNTAPMPTEASHGKRTTIVATSILITRERYRQLGAEMIWWMTSSPLALPSWITRSAGFYLYPDTRTKLLVGEMNARPTTGLRVIELLSRLPCASVNLFGFDFFASFSLSDNRLSAPDAHNVAGEREYVNGLMSEDKRFQLIDPGATSGV